MKPNFNIACKAYTVMALIIGMGLPLSAHAVIAGPSTLAVTMTLDPVAETALWDAFIESKPDSGVLWVQNMISASEAKSIAQRKVRNAEVVDISREGGVYRVRMIRKDGRVIDVFIDAKTGTVKK